MCLKERFWSKVEVASDDDCWIWTGARDSSGYGSIRDEVENGGRRLVASRLSLIMHSGEIREDMYAMHKCDNPPCVNPNHLHWGTPEENVQDMTDKGRAAWQMMQGV